VKRILRESEHLVRLVLLAAILVVAFLVIRKAVVPAGFGRYGHYRAPSLDDIRARPISFAGHEACEACHDEQAKTKSQGKHARPAGGARRRPARQQSREARPGHALRALP
jgi:hypothetical protein